MVSLVRASEVILVHRFPSLPNVTIVLSDIRRFGFVCSTPVGNVRVRVCVLVGVNDEETIPHRLHRYRGRVRNGPG